MPTDVDEFDQTGVLCMAIKSFIVKFDTIECVSLLFGCCNIKIWLYKLSQVILLEKAGNRLQCSPRRSNHLEHCRRLPFIRNNAETYN